MSDTLPPPPWAAADEAALRRALDAAGPSDVPRPSFGEYLLDLGAWLRDALLETLSRAMPSDGPGLFQRLALWTAVGAAAIAALVVLAVAARRLRRRAAAPTAAAALAAPSPETSGDAEWWAGELVRRLEAGSLHGALAALWWWVARRLDPPGLEPSWTTGELLRASGRTGLREPLRRLDRLQWGTAEPRRDDVEALVRTLREALP